MDSHEPLLHLQVQKSASHYTEAARDEITLLTQIRDGDATDSRHCVRLYDWFEHRGTHGLHICMVFEVRCIDSCFAVGAAWSLHVSQLCCMDFQDLGIRGHPLCFSTVTHETCLGSSEGGPPSEGPLASLLKLKETLSSFSLREDEASYVMTCCLFIMVCRLQVLGDNLLSLIKAYSYRNIPLHLVKHITKQVSNQAHPCQDRSMMATSTSVKVSR